MDLLTINDLQTYFYTPHGVVRAVDGVNFTMGRGRTEGLVGESGCGKSVTALSIMKLISPPGKIVGGKIIFEGEDLLVKTSREMRKVRGNRIAMIFQEPLSSLNPVLTIGRQVAEVFRLHRGFTRAESRERAVEMLELVGIPSPKERMNAYPHQLSGGMRQRVMIAMALSCHPALLIADEPTTALDVTIQAQILDLLEDLAGRTGTSLLLITHDLTVVAHLCQGTAVMYAGSIVERAPTSLLFKNPGHPYTRGLLNSIPRMGTVVRRLQTIEGTVPDLAALPAGCPFLPRCPAHLEICHRQKPVLTEMEKDHFVSCWKAAAL